MKKILIATSNPGKKKELQDFLGDLKGFEFLSLNDFETVSEPEENGNSYESNALIKARYYGQKFNIPTLAEDSGLEVEAFPHSFGINTKREIDGKDDIDWLRIFLLKMEETENRNAKFVSCICLWNPDEEPITKRGVTSGVITEFPQAPIQKGIPLSSVFLPEDAEEVFSCLTKRQKNAISHRGKAAQKMAEVLKKS